MVICGVVVIFMGRVGLLKEVMVSIVVSCVVDMVVLDDAVYSSVPFMVVVGSGVDSITDPPTIVVGSVAVIMGGVVASRVVVTSSLVSRLVVVGLLVRLEAYGRSAGKAMMKWATWVGRGEISHEMPFPTARVSGVEILWWFGAKTWCFDKLRTPNEWRWGAASFGTLFTSFCKNMILISRAV
ncbi:hypothetical protein PI126_g19651 [Phytophthora idaei]|nr:hypothetical protein PI126_g19651 [Phytophthora idaei]